MAFLKASLIFPAFCTCNTASMKTALGEWAQGERENSGNKDAYGHSRGSLGPIWMGQRIRSSITDPGAYQDLIYAKGAYILQMLRMQLMNSREPDPDRAFTK